MLEIKNYNTIAININKAIDKNSDEELDFICKYYVDLLIKSHRLNGNVSQASSYDLKQLTKTLKKAFPQLQTVTIISIIKKLLVFTIKQFKILDSNFSYINISKKNGHQYKQALNLSIHYECLLNLKKVLLKQLEMTEENNMRDNLKLLKKVCEKNANV